LNRPTVASGHCYRDGKCTQPVIGLADDQVVERAEPYAIEPPELPSFTQLRVPAMARRATPQGIGVI